MTAVDEICQLDEAIVSAYARFENGADPTKCLEWLWEEYTQIMKGEAVYPMDDLEPDDKDEPDEPPSRTEYDLNTNPDGSVDGRCWTNDNRDQGYPSETASWDVHYHTVDEALKRTGRSHRGWIGSIVTVYLDGRKV